MPFLLLQEWKLKELVFYILTCLLRKIKEQTNLSKNHKEKKIIKHAYVLVTNFK